MPRSVTSRRLWQRRPLRALAAACLPVVAAGPALAQEAAAGTPTNVVTSTRPMFLEGVIVGLMVIAALFAVCRASRRN
ncbi:MAG: hypothetical protein KF774_19970 [Planctomyces sp.]|nr:hypothetical protein [Planctomyces sp.]